MSRVDAWEVHIKQKADTIDIGAAKDFQKKYAVGRVIGKGGFGTVKIVVERATGKEFACKTINKRLEEQGVGGRKQERHIANVRREIAVLRRLRGTLNVAHFKQAFEDDADLHIVMEYCQGGELWHRIGNKFYTERTVASFMRAVLRTLSQCHAHRILHRDIKPGNFMLLNDSDRAPLKAIDFGLAVFYEPSTLPRTDLGLEGTPWFMAPEVMSSEVYPSSDIWAAGVMTYQLLSGQLPFDDRRKPNSPALSVVWQAILTQQPSFTGKAWQDISEPAKNFVKRLLNKDPKARPSAKDALQDPWLKGNSMERNQGKPIDATVVQRIQRYAQTSVLKRSIFELIAAELIKTMTEQLSAASPEPSRHNGQDNMDAALSSSLGSIQHTPSDGSPVAPPSSSWSPFMGCAGRKHSIGQPMTDAGSSGITIRNKVGASAHGSLEYHRAFGAAKDSLGSSMSVHEAGYWRLMKTAVEAAKLRRASSMHGAHHYLRASKSWSVPDREQHRKAARIALDTSAHAGSHYQNFVHLSDDQDEEMASPNPQPQQQQQHNNVFRHSAPERASSINLGKLSVERHQHLFQQNLPAAIRSQMAASIPDQAKSSSDARSGGTTEAGKRGQSQYSQFLRRSSADMGQANPDVQQSGMELPRRSNDQWQADTEMASAQSATATAAAALVVSKLPTATPSAQQASTTAVVKSGPEEQKLEKRPSRVHFVPSHIVQQTALSAADSVQEAASHGEQMMGPQQASLQAQEPQQAQHAQQEAQHAKQAHQGQQPTQPEQRQTNAKRTFQEILRQQLQAHSHQVTPEDGNTPDPSTHLPSPHSTPPLSHQRSHVSFQDMLRQQLGQQVGNQDSSMQQAPAVQNARGSYQEILKQQLHGAAAMPGPTAIVDDSLEPRLQQSYGNAGMYLSGSKAGAHSEDLSPLTPGHSMAQITPGGLRLYDAEGSCSMVPLEELKQIMSKLSFSREEAGISAEQLAEGLKSLGYDLAQSELGVLMGTISLTQQGQVAKPAFLASQVDWQDFQQNFKDQWLECARAAFASMDSAETGHITSSQLVGMLSTKLPAEEVEHAVEDALMEAGCGGASVMLLSLMWVYVHFIRCMALHTCKQSQRAAHVY
ncbi:TPA: hypothetical protein ACH3X1_011269 [Trebouxia sp. C0004]